MTDRSSLSHLSTQHAKRLRQEARGTKKSDGDSIASQFSPSPFRTVSATWHGPRSVRENGYSIRGIVNQSLELQRLIRLYGEGPGVPAADAPGSLYFTL